MAPLRPADIFVIQSAIEQYMRKHPGQGTPSAEVALAWQIERHRGRKLKAPAIIQDVGFFSRVFENLRFLLKPVSSLPR